MQAEGNRKRTPRLCPSQYASDLQARGWVELAVTRQVLSFIIRIQVCPAHLHLLLYT